MFQIGKKETLYGYVDVLIAQLANIIVLPIVLNRVCIEEYAFWSIFVSIQAFVALFESGFSVLVVRYTTYAISGAESIPVSGIPEVRKDYINYNLLKGIILVSKKYYLKITVLATAVLFAFSGYIFWKAKDMPNCSIIMISWVIFSVGIALNLYFTVYTAVIKGAGKIKELRIISITTNILQSLLKIGFVILNLGLLGIALAVMIVIIIKRFWIKAETKRIINLKDNKIRSVSYEEREQISFAMHKNARQLGLSVVAQYIESQGTVLICSIFLPLDVVSKYGLTLQIINVISSVATTPTSTFQPLLNQSIVQKDKVRTQYYFSILTVVIMATYWGACFLAFLCVPTMLEIIKSNTELVGTTIFLIMTLYQYEIIMHQRATQLISYSNDQRYVKSYIVTAFVELLCAFITLGLLNGNITLYVGALAIVELFNFIVWQRFACKMVDSSIWGLINCGMKNLVQYLKKV